MKTALSTLALALITTAVAPAGNAPSHGQNGSHHASSKSCSHCTKAPCGCGYSPSYYTANRKRQTHAIAKHYPIATHWSRPYAGQTRLATTARGAIGAPVVNAPTPARSPGYVAEKKPGHGFEYDRITRPLFGSHHNSRFYGKPVYTRTTSRSALGAPVVPAVRPTVRLGFVPSQSWAGRIAARNYASHAYATRCFTNRGSHSRGHSSRRGSRRH